MNKLTTEQFIERAVLVHGDLYDYSESLYTLSSIKVTIICKTHGAFHQRPTDHTGKKQGCPKCGKLSQANNRRHDVKDFIAEARQVHGDVYDYSQVIYVNTHTKVTIVCPEHGAFTQKPNSHVSQKNGCPRCWEHPGRYTDNTIERHDCPARFYVIKLTHEGEEFIKVGITKTTIQQRYLGKKGVYELEVLVDEPMMLSEAYAKEQKMLKDNVEFKYTPRHPFQGHTECLRITNYC